MLLRDVATAADQITVSQASPLRRRRQISPLIPPLRRALYFLLKIRRACADLFLSD